MLDRFKYLRWLSTVCFVFAWLALLWGLFALVTAQITDEKSYDLFTQSWDIRKKGIGLAGVVAIVVDTSLRFVMLMGASQAMKLWLHVDQAIDGIAQRLGDLTIATTDIKAGILKTSADVRMVGTLVYEEAKKAD
ncbi:MAG: hypothetical protein JNK04_24440 [Myxococcales bacterium]|nr:hypothetical protein [Myxococcales bacterium]